MLSLEKSLIPVNQRVVSENFSWIELIPIISVEDHNEIVSGAMQVLKSAFEYRVGLKPEDSDNSEVVREFLLFFNEFDIVEKLKTEDRMLEEKDLEEFANLKFKEEQKEENPNDQENTSESKKKEPKGQEEDQEEGIQTGKEKGSMVQNLEAVPHPTVNDDLQEDNAGESVPV